MLYMRTGSNPAVISRFRGHTGNNFINLFSAEIVIPGTGSATAPVCVVSTLNIMVSKESDVLATAGSGWIDVQNTTSDEPQFQQPFQLFRDGGRTLLQVGDFLCFKKNRRFKDKTVSYKQSFPQSFKCVEIYL